MPTYLFYNRTKPNYRTTINGTKITKPAKSPYTLYDTTCTVITAI